MGTSVIDIGRGSGVRALYYYTRADCSVSILLLTNKLPRKYGEFRKNRALEGASTFVLESTKVPSCDIQEKQVLFRLIVFRVINYRLEENKHGC